MPGVGCIYALPTWSTQKRAKASAPSLVCSWAAAGTGSNAGAEGVGAVEPVEVDPGSPVDVVGVEVLGVLARVLACGAGVSLDPHAASAAAHTAAVAHTAK